jgi:N-acetylmuramic acid 6-phosphate etherase
VRTQITEGYDPALADLDLRPTSEIVRVVSEANAVVLDALCEAQEALAALVDAAAARPGRVIYVGAGSAGQMAAADAAEWGPTFSVADDAVVALVAGADLPHGPLREAAEDDSDAGAAELCALAPTTQDVVVAVSASASGTTPYAIGALRSAREAGARLKARTAQKLALNAFSTALMVRRGRTYGNLMSAMRIANTKLRERALRICHLASGCDEDTARATLAAADDDLEVALVALLAEVGPDEARARLAAAGSVREAAR